MTAAPAGGRPFWSRPLPVAAAVLALAAAIHLPTFGGYVFADDVQWILGARAFRFGQLFELGWRNHFFRPVVELYFAVVGRTLGDAPSTLHTLNVLLHAGNALLLWRLARALGASPAAAGLAALIFVGHNRAVPSTAWISGVTAVLSTTFLLAALVFHLEALRTGRTAARVAAVVAFTAALLTHETSVMAWPMLLAAEWAVGQGPATLRARPRIWWWTQAAYALALVAFLAAAVVINRRNYVVTQGHYRFGAHAAVNLLRYLDALYVGRAEGAALLLTGAAYAAFAAVRSAVVRFGLAALVLALIPCSFFTWGETMRYLYLPSAFFALALADGLVRLAALAGQGSHAALKQAVLALVVAVLVGRFAHFAAKSARDARRANERYRQYVVQVQAAHRGRAPGSTLVLPKPRKGEPDDIYVEPLLQMAYGDPALRVELAR